MPADPSQAFLTGVRLALADAGHAAPSLQRVLHGTTVATNMILEGKGARTALVTTEGFRHVLDDRPAGHPAARQLLRLGETGASRAGLARARGQGADRRRRRGDRAARRGERAAAAEACRALGVEAVAVCLLHSFANPAHERRVAEILRRGLPGIAVTASVDVLPVVREYERSLATVLNALVMPGVSTYVSPARGSAGGREASPRRFC